MTLPLHRFCVNRKIAPALGLEAFFRLVNQLGLSKVELRNDLPGGSVTDNLSGQQVRALADRYQIEILTINAVYPFNQLTDDVRQLTDALLRDAQSVGARALVLCPLNDGRTVEPGETVAALRELASRFADYGIEGLVEPLGFIQSSLRSAVQAQTLICEAGAPFKILLDTFHHYLYAPDAEEFARLDVKQIGLVHLSGVEDARPREQLTDDERVMLTPTDRLQSAAQVRELEARGYQGVYAFEPFAPQLMAWREREIAAALESSIALIQQTVAMPAYS